MTVLDLLMKPELVKQAWDYFSNVQTKDEKYIAVHPPGGQAGDLAERADHGEVPAEMKKFYYDPTKYKTISSSSGSSTRR